ncbi:Leucine-rich repeat (LRR) protein [Zhouia amylolytica]|uniref:Leucine-rich repeat (LRR) protein n=1 Tax=Zhouia amylolytica TaxID=376730 RepID=A0A1I6QEC0_9FLAO|nr:leucine-rich repeat domain-containing protein [Zhouia amylolytica]MCQ0111312.1 hypothetical protein [Zhouia amylolytica]SFS50675.1 Leucine-rich repeat (LRR) protein [Zhouia amylolytica]
MKRQLLNLLVATVIVFSCSKDDSSSGEEIPKSNLKEIESFEFLASDNEGLDTDVVASIDESEKLITATMPVGTDISNLKPSIQSSPLSKVTPSDQTRIDFTQAVEYAVTAEDETSIIYNVNIEVAKSSEAKVTSFNLLTSINSDGTDSNQIYYDIEANIDETNKTIKLTIPEGSIDSGLIPSIEFSVGATITPSPEDVLVEGVNYTVTAENGDTNTYSLIIEYTPNERKILIDLYQANLENLLNWDITSLNIAEWEGITLYDQRVTQIDLTNKNIENLIPQIGKLTQLTDLVVQNTDSALKMNSIPEEIGNLTNLRSLFLNGNNINSIPASIGNLTQLDRLALNSNRIAWLPEELGNLTNLKWLILSDNNIQFLPISVGNLTSLTELFLNNNQLQEIPEELGNLKEIKVLRLRTNKLISLNNSVIDMTQIETVDLAYNDFQQFPSQLIEMDNLKNILFDGNDLQTVPATLGDMNNLETASFYRNRLFLIPEELGNLTNLKTLNIQRNFLFGIPQPVCDLETNYGTQIIKDNRTDCY